MIQLSVRLSVLGGLAAGATLLAQLAASAVTTTVGQTFVPDAADSCTPRHADTSLELFQTARADGTSYAVPHDGVITSWSFHGSDAQDTFVTMRVYRPEPAGTPDGGPDQFMPVGDGGPVAPHNGDQELVTRTRVPVKSGDIIGLLGTQFAGLPAGRCASTGGTGDTYRFLQGTVPTDVGVVTNYVETSGLKIDVSAVVEPDVDGDGFGDDTQDACPRLASTQDACPIPNTKITKHPVSPTHNRTARFRFTSDVAGATFRCKLDAHPYKSCTSPHLVDVRPGRHTFQVRAHANQATDATAAKIRWRVLR
jgi:hypothetical protein